MHVANTRSKMNGRRVGRSFVGIHYKEEVIGCDQGHKMNYQSASISRGGTSMSKSSHP